MDDFVLRLRWTCHKCGWSIAMNAPGFAGDGIYHYPDGRTACGPITAQKDNSYPDPGDTHKRIKESPA